MTAKIEQLPAGWTCNGDPVQVSRTPYDFRCVVVSGTRSISLVAAAEVDGAERFVGNVRFTSTERDLEAAIRAAVRPAWLTPILQAQFLLLARHFDVLNASKKGRPAFHLQHILVRKLLGEIVALSDLTDQMQDVEQPPAQLLNIASSGDRADALLHELIEMGWHAWNSDAMLTLHYHLLHPEHDLPDLPDELVVGDESLDAEEREGLAMALADESARAQAFHGAAYHILNSARPGQYPIEAGLLLEANPLRLHTIAVAIELGLSVEAELDQVGANFLTYRDRIVADPGIIYRDKPYDGATLMALLEPTSGHLDPLAELMPSTSVLAYLQRLEEESELELLEEDRFMGVGLILPTTALPVTCQYYEQVRCLLTPTGIWCSALTHSIGLRYDLMFYSGSGLDTIELSLPGAESWVFRAVLAGLWHDACQDLIRPLDVLAPDRKLKHPKTRQNVELPLMLSIDWRSRTETAAILGTMLHQN
jgi:hypothetical protein